MDRKRDHYEIEDALSSLFESYGAQVAPSNTDPPFLRVVIEDIRIAIGFSFTSQPITSMIVGDFLGATMESFFHHFVFISNHALTDDMIDYARHHKVILLDRHDLELELGKTHLRELEVFNHPRIHHSPEDEEPEKPLVRRSVSNGNPIVAERKPELLQVLEGYRELHLSENAIIDHISKGGENRTTVVVGSDKRYSDDGNGMNNGQTQPIGQEPTLEVPDSLRDQYHNTSSENVNINGQKAAQPSEPRTESADIVLPKVSITSLTGICQRINPINNTQMELIPYFLFSYSCWILDEGKDTEHDRTGLLAINGITLAVEEWQTGFETTPELKMDYVRLVPRADKKVARDLAFNGVVQLNTKVIEVSAESNGVQKNGTRKIIPDTSSIRLIFEGVSYFPHWHVRGEGGSMFVDAVNGDVISSQKV